MRSEILSWLSQDSQELFFFDKFIVQSNIRFYRFYEVMDAVADFD